MIINQVVSGGGTPTPTEKYPLLSRVKDDSNNEIGTVCGYHTDANNQKYAVVCLDRAYRTNVAGSLLSSAVQVSGIPSYNDMSVYTAPETSTKNCDEILATVTSQGLTSDAVTKCRNYSFVIEGVTYYGQLPSMVELVYILINRTTINAIDTSASYSGPEIQTTYLYWSSSFNYNKGWLVTATGVITNIDSSNNTPRVIPVLEIPIQ